MKYSFTINQKAIKDNELDLDVVDAAIFDIIKDFSGSDVVRKTIEHGRVYFWISWRLIIEQGPLLKLTTRQSVYNRLENLVRAGLIERHPENKQLSTSWFCFGINYDKILFSQRFEAQNPLNTPVNNNLQPIQTISKPILPPVNNNLQPVKKDLQVQPETCKQKLPPVNENLQVDDKTCKNQFTPPVNQNLQNNILLSDNIYSSTSSTSRAYEENPVWVDEEKKEVQQIVEDLKKKSPPVATPPPFNRADYEKHLFGLTSAREQMGRSLKLYSEADYIALINQFLTENIEDGKVWKDVYDCGSHFRRWIPYVSFKTKPINGNTENTHQAGRGLKPVGIEPKQGREFGDSW